MIPNWVVILIIIGTALFITGCGYLAYRHEKAKRRTMRFPNGIPRTRYGCTEITFYAATPHWESSLDGSKSLQLHDGGQFIYSNGKEH